MARAAKRAKTGNSSPQALGQLRSAASVRSLRFKDLAKAVKDVGEGDPNSTPERLEIVLDTKNTIFDFFGTMGAILFVDLFHPGAQTVVKLKGLIDVLDDCLLRTKAGAEDPACRQQLSKAKKILKNYYTQFENLYYFESSLEEMVISLNGFFLDFGDKMGVDVSNMIAAAPKGMFR